MGIIIFSESQNSRVVEYLQDTCKDVSDVILAFPFLSAMDYDTATDSVNAFLAEIGLQNCNVCGWWEEEGEWSDESGEIVCNDCQD